jgi:GNAT superfamily N-acetyltransferase
VNNGTTRSQFITSFDVEVISELEAGFRGRDFYLTLASPADYPAVEALSTAAAREEVAIPLGAATIEWLVDKNPQGQGFLVLARSTSDAQIVGHFLFYAKAMEFRERGGKEAAPLTAYLCVYLFVAPHYRRRGLFDQMTAFGVGLLQRTGLSLVYTVPNPRSAPGFLKFGMTSLGTIPFRIGWAGKWKIGLLARRAVKAVERRDGFGHQLIALQHPMRSRQALMWGQRNIELLDWRYRDRPEVDYGIWRLNEGGRADGYLVTRRMTIMNFETLVLCDFWLEQPSTAALNKLIAAALAAEHGRGANLVITMAGSPDTKMGSALWRAGLIRLPQRLLPQPVVVIGGFIDDGGRSAVPSVKSWLSTPYDWDVF